MFGSKTTIKHTKITREFGPDGKVVKEVIETTATPEEASKDTEEFAKEFEGMHKRVNDFFGDINNLFGKLWGRK